MGRSRAISVRLTLNEANAIGRAVDGNEPSTEAEFASLERALGKIDHALQRYQRKRRRHEI